MRRASATLSPATSSDPRHEPTISINFMRSTNDPAIEFINAMVGRHKTPSRELGDKLVAALYLLLVDTGVQLYRTLYFKGVKSPGGFESPSSVLAVSESWALSLCEASDITFEWFAEYAKARWARDASNPRSRVAKLIRGDVDVYESRAVKS